MLSSHNHTISDYLQQRYSEFVTFKLVPYHGDISVFVFLFENEPRLADCWEKIAGNIAGNYQSDLTDDFAVWNIYSFYLCRTRVSLSLKYKIENDRFSSRKIVLDNYSEDISDIGVNDVIREHITNLDIRYDPDEEITKKLSLEIAADAIVWNMIKDLTLKPGKQSYLESEQLLSEIEEKLKNEDQQS